MNLKSNFTIKTFHARPVSLATVFEFGRVVQRERPDILHSLFPLTPLFYRGPLLVTIYDLQALLVPEFTGRRPWPLRKAYDLFYGWAYPRAVRRAKYVHTVSEATRRDIARVFPRYADRAIVVHPGITAEPLMECSPELLEHIRRRFGLPDRYILYIGSTRPNKNLPTMIRAYALALHDCPALQNTSLVLVVSPDRFFAECSRLIRGLKLSERVQIYRSITEEEKKAFYHGSQALYLVTKFEGFGLPLLEAQACGVPVLAANHAALPEIGGDSALFVNPDDVRAVADGLVRILTDEPLRQSLIEKGRKNLNRFRWEKTIQTMLQIYKNLF
ncbi:MAG: glycosyltransferase family 4 protein [Candidatus Sumerlaeia bacterium]|nr:glycosyltransferase family 4 protein [Candidatus Sumerlaeia bacterium]